MQYNRQLQASSENGGMVYQDVSWCAPFAAPENRAAVVRPADGEALDFLEPDVSVVSCHFPSPD